MTNRKKGEKGPTAGHGSKLGSKQEAAIAALLSQRNQEEAAQAARGLTVCIRRPRRTGAKGNQRGCVIQAAPIGRIVKTAETQVDIKRALCAGKWQAQRE